MLPTRELLARIPGLSVHPRSLDSLFTALADPGVRADDLVPIVVHDVGLTAGMLKTCNAPLYRWSGSVGSVREARCRLGEDGFIRVATQLSVEPRHYKDLYGFAAEADDLRRHGLAVATAAGELVEMLGRADLYEHVFTAGLLHEIGRVVQHRLRVESNGDCRAQGEHSDLGGDVAERLRLPRVMAAAIRMQEHPDLAGEYVTATRALHGGIRLARMADGALCAADRRDAVALLAEWGVPVERVVELSDELADMIEGDQAISRMFLQSA